MMIQPETTTNPNESLYSAELFKKPDIGVLNGYYTDGDSCDQPIFAEQRSSILLVSGEHYNNKNTSFFKRLRDARSLNDEQKLRITKNHVRKICQIYANNIVSMNPNVGITPKDETSMHDEKVAELHKSVWMDAWGRYDLDDKIDDWADNFVQIGEVAVKIFFDPSLGAAKGYHPQTDPATGNPSMNEFGQMTPDETKPIVPGEFVFEDIYGFNLLRPPECKDLRKAEWLCIRKMTNQNELKRRFKDNPDLQKMVNSSQDETFVIFDALGGGYKKSSKQTMIREYYFRPSLLFPEGYYYITTKDGILAEGTLPGGLFPIIISCFDKVQTTPRGRSPVKTMRPYQAEINRCSSKIAEHQISLGDDKLLIRNGSQVSAGTSLPGIRTVNVTGMDPTVLPGRDGSQYFAYMNSQITELYNVMMVAEDSEMADTNGLDPYTLLFRSARQKKKFQRYIKRFEKFLVEIVKLYLALAKTHMPDDAVVWAVGKNEQINIPEFRMLPDTCYEVNIEAQSDDIETKLGKQLVLNHALQYVGPQLERDDIGKLLRQMPFANVDETLDDFTMNYDQSKNEMLALDRGERPPVGQSTDHIYMIKKLSNRMSKPDFRTLAPAIQQNYQEKIQVHQQFEAANKMAIQRAEQGFIPTGGYLVALDFYVKDPSDKTGVKTRRARLPYASVEWLIGQLESQGQSEASFGGMDQGSQAAISNMMIEQGAGQPQQQEQPMATNGMGGMGQ